MKSLLITVLSVITWFHAADAQIGCDIDICECSENVYVNECKELTCIKQAESLKPCTADDCPPCRVAVNTLKSVIIAYDYNSLGKCSMTPGMKNCGKSNEDHPIKVFNTKVKVYSNAELSSYFANTADSRKPVHEERNTIPTEKVTRINADGGVEHDAREGSSPISTKSLARQIKAKSMSSLQSSRTKPPVLESDVISFATSHHRCGEKVLLKVLFGSLAVILLITAY